ncbi:MAG: 2-dehydropantoate 2-reductase N-terminal domain-containing protein, partial [Candidatus Omnitrophota bacterium]
TDVTLICKPEQSKIIEKKGITIEGQRGKQNIPLKTNTQLDKIYDLVILATKTQSIEDFVRGNINFLKDTLILTTQNGLAAERILQKYIEVKNIFSSIVMFGATYEEAGQAIHNFEGDWIIGKIENPNDNKLQELSKILGKSFKITISSNIKGQKWTKVFLNMNNCLPAALGLSMQEVFSDLNICQISIQLWQEALNLIDAAGIKLESLPTFSIEKLHGLCNMPIAESTRVFSGIMTNLSKTPVYGSILQSIKRGRPSEIDYINGEIIELAKSLNKVSPLNKKLTDLVHEVEKNNKFFTKNELLAQIRNLSATELRRI